MAISPNRSFPVTPVFLVILLSLNEGDSFEAPFKVLPFAWATPQVPDSLGSRMSLHMSARSAPRTTSVVGQLGDPRLVIHLIYVKGSLTHSRIANSFSGRFSRVSFFQK